MIVYLCATIAYNEKERKRKVFLMKKIIAALVSIMLVACAIPALSEGTYANRLEKILGTGKLTFATSPDYAPYEFYDLTKTGQDAIVGADIELAKYIADALGVELVIEPMDFDSLLAAVGTASVDLVLAGMVPKEERMTMMDFTDVYYNDGDQVVLILADTADEYSTLSAFAGKTVAAQNGTLQMEMVMGQLLDAKAEPITAIPNAILMLQTGKVQGVALASVVADQYIANYPDLAICAERFEYDSLGVAGAVPKNEPELLAKLNEILAQVIEEGLFYEWIDAANELAGGMEN